MLVGFAEGLGAAKTYATREHYEIDANHELLGLGGANIAAGLSSGMVVNGSLSKTAVNGSAGARTQLSGLIVAALSILTLLALTGLFEDLPEATLAAIVIAAVIELVDYHALIELYRAHTERLGRQFGFASRPDFIAAIAALLGVTVFDTLPGLFVGIGISLLLLIYRASRPYIATLGREPGPTAATATSTVTQTTSCRRTSPYCGLRAACTSPTPTPSELASCRPRPRTASPPSFSTPRRSLSSTSSLPGCSPRSQKTWAGATCGCSWPATSGRYATSFAASSTTPRSPTSTQPYKPP